MECIGKGLPKKTTEICVVGNHWRGKLSILRSKPDTVTILVQRYQPHSNYLRCFSRFVTSEKLKEAAYQHYPLHTYIEKSIFLVVRKTFY